MKRVALLARLSLVSTLFGVLSTCGGDGNPPTDPSGNGEPPDPVLTSIVVSPGSNSLSAIEQTVQLSAVPRDQDGGSMSGVTFSWSSSDGAVASVTSSGLVKALDRGQATIRATSGSVAGTATVTVEQIVASVAVSPTDVTLTELGGSQQFIAEAGDANGHSIPGITYSWDSSDVSVSTVSETGLATAVGEGQVTISASAGSHEGSGTLTVLLPSQLVFTRFESSTFAVCLINLDGTGFVQLADGFASDVSSDGTKILFTTPVPPDNAVWQMSADGSNPVQLTPGTGVYLGARWSPDGSKIAYAYRSGGVDFEIWVMNADGSDPVQLTNNESTDLSPSWSPDGSKIAFETTRDGNREIYTMDADGGNPTRLTNDFTDDMQPDWSPDGSLIVFASNRGPDILEIWVMNADGSNAVQLTEGLSLESGVEPDPNWSPDGSRIAFSAQLNDNSSKNIGVMNADGSGIVQVTAGFTDNVPRWRPQAP